MPRNIYGGNKAKKGKNKKFVNTELIFKENDDYDYAQVINNLGNGQLDLVIINKNGYLKKSIGIIRGKIRKVKFYKNDIVLIGYRDFEKKYKNITLCDVLYKYSEDHKNMLVHYGEISIYRDELSDLTNYDDIVVFENEDSYGNSDNDSELSDKDLSEDDKESVLDKPEINELEVVDDENSESSEIDIDKI